MIVSPPFLWRTVRTSSRVEAIAVAVHLRDDVADLEAGFGRRAFGFDRADQDARVLGRAEVLAQLRRHLDRADSDETATRGPVHAHDEGMNAFGDVVEIGDRLRFVPVAPDVDPVAVDDDLLLG